MIVMKFGGASLSSPASMKRVVSLVRSERHRHPIVVVSALGDTTDHLVSILGHACRAESYGGWKAQENLKNYHFSVAEDLLSGERLDSLHSWMRSAFRDLHVRTLEVCEGERPLTPELRDWVLSLGEQLSSRIFTAVLEEHGIPALHQDARQLILTDDRFTNAQPRQWETYARLRWSVPLAARDHVVVLGGFIGATEDGRTTTLGRGGSDLTASLVGAAVNAEEIQVWKDVDGLLTWDPKIKAGGYRVKRLSYEEAAELAGGGATILHPDTVAPAQRLHIPVVIRNTFRPEGEGTTISIQQGKGSGVVKSIACRTRVTLLELQSPDNYVRWPEYSAQWEHLCQQGNMAGTLLGQSENTLYIALETKTCVPEFALKLDGCVEVHLRTEQAILTLVGEGIRQAGMTGRVRDLLASSEALLLPGSSGSCALRVAVPDHSLVTYLDLFQRAFFTNLNSQYFAISSPADESRKHSQETRSMELSTAAVPLARPGLPLWPLPSR